jgi:acyl carrier protein
VNEDTITAIVRRALENVAPELEGVAIDPAKTFRDQFDIDSMDLLNFVIGIHQETGLDIPEADYPQLASLRGCWRYLSARLPPQP